MKITPEEQEAGFKCLTGVYLNTKESEEPETILGNKAYFALSHIFRCKIVHGKALTYLRICQSGKLRRPCKR